MLNRLLEKLFYYRIKRKKEEKKQVSKELV